MHQVGSIYKTNNLCLKIQIVADRGTQAEGVPELGAGEEMRA